jgi:hypothetical protein
MSVTRCMRLWASKIRCVCDCVTTNVWSITNVCGVVWSEHIPIYVSCIRFLITDPYHVCGSGYIYGIT